MLVRKVRSSCTGSNIFDLILGMLLSSVIDQDIQSPKLSDRLLNYVLTKLLVTHIPCHGQASMVFIRHYPFCFL